ncbi:hypothetical protein FIBSPDRAFT_189110 [Athelia psychrophila]|uniref:Uncharacterized protein n=1 Tax=Athelia psychrophila TaxID=1759441 RepID=A0A166A2Y4_9AGAM|nr:hypothetical protein FIBSPDRAFT_189110 [Fibularhizoctonia sp. CBS 109695]
MQGSRVNAKEVWAKGSNRVPLDVFLGLGRTSPTRRTTSRTPSASCSGASCSPPTRSTQPRPPCRERARRDDPAGAAESGSTTTGAGLWAGTTRSSMGCRTAACSCRRCCRRCGRSVLRERQPELDDKRAPGPGLGGGVDGGMAGECRGGGARGGAGAFPSFLLAGLPLDMYVGRLRRLRRQHHVRPRRALLCTVSCSCSFPAPAAHNWRARCRRVWRIYGLAWMAFLADTCMRPRRGASVGSLRSQHVQTLATMYFSLPEPFHT